MKKEEKDGFDEMIDKYTPIKLEEISIKEVYEGDELGPEIMKKKKSNKKWVYKPKGENK